MSPVQITDHISAVSSELCNCLPRDAYPCRKSVKIDRQRVYILQAFTVHAYTKCTAQPLTIRLRTYRQKLLLKMRQCCNGQGRDLYLQCFT